MKKELTDVYLRSLKKPSTGRLEVADIIARGLTFRFSSSGARAWSFRFRDPVSGRVMRQTFSGDLSLKQARVAAHEARGKVATGQNPVEEKRKARRDAAAKTFDNLADRYLIEHARRHKRSADADERMLRLHVRPEWGSRRFETISRRDVIELCEAIVADGKPTQANRVQALVSKIFSFALDADLISSHPCARLAKRSKENRRTRTLSDGEIRLFWDAIGTPPNSLRMGLALKFALLTGARVNEIAGARIAEFEALDNSGKAMWTIPASRSKNGKAHSIPLAEAGCVIASELIRIAHSRSETPTGVEFLFRSPRGSGRPIAGHALSVAMLRFGVTMGGRAEEGPIAARTWQADQPSAHDLRRTMATRMAANGVPAEDVSACLNHARKGVTAAHYDHYDRAAEKRRAFQTWARLLEGIRASSTI